MEVTALCIKLLLNLFLLLTARGSYSSQKVGEVFLRIDPNKLQFFEYESISLRCEGSHGPTEWRVLKKLLSQSTQWETSAGSLNITPALVSHSGEYFCENEEGERSNSINITITAGDVILESPAPPLMEGDNVVLRCRKRSFPNLPSDFYKDGILSNTGYLGEVIIDKVSTSDEGSYKCRISVSHEESSETWLTVTADIPASQVTATEDGRESSSHPPHPDSLQLFAVLRIIFTLFCLSLLVLVVGLLQCRKNKVSRLVYAFLLRNQHQDQTQVSDMKTPD
ncbi:Low affinity immunoglobulin gamma Fc region receptor II Fc gamma receptor IIB [Channa argus]|nr:Low affinity immunoglobulin gamma Fc region receptor II Fc gamma receptor IIB [Channa argus]